YCAYPVYLLCLSSIPTVPTQYTYCAYPVYLLCPHSIPTVPTQYTYCAATVGRPCPRRMAPTLYGNVLGKLPVGGQRPSARQGGCYTGKCVPILIRYRCAGRART